MTRLDLNYDGLLSGATLEQKADSICRLYAIKIRLQSLRAIVSRYAFPAADPVWPMISQTVAGHAFTMAQIIGPLYLEFLDIFPDKMIPVETLESIAINHDNAEALTGDAATDVDGITREMKDMAEQASVKRQYSGMVCLSYMQEKFVTYEAKMSYPSKLVKMLDAVELVFFAQYCVRNGVGMLSRGGNENEFLIEVFGKKLPVDKRTHQEIRDYFQSEGRDEGPISEIMYMHSLPRIDRLGRAELTGLFKLLCARAFVFPFEKFNLQNLPMDFTKLT